MYLSCDTKKFHDNESTHILHNFWTSTHRGEASPIPPGGATDTSYYAWQLYYYNLGIFSLTDRQRTLYIRNSETRDTSVAGFAKGTSVCPSVTVVDSVAYLGGDWAMPPFGLDTKNFEHIEPKKAKICKREQFSMFMLYIESNQGRQV